MHVYMVHAYKIYAEQGTYAQDAHRTTNILYKIHRETGVEWKERERGEGRRWTEGTGTKWKVTWDARGMMGKRTMELMSE